MATMKARRTIYGVAHRDVKRHAFIPGRGYFLIGEPKSTAGGLPDKCNPPSNAAHGSWHSLKHQSSTVNFQWLADQRCWYRFQAGSRRLGYAPEYLSKAGWTYGSPAKGRHQ
jgi:hypothetical protein